MKKKRGFTLIELLTSIMLLTVIGGVIIFNMTNVSKTSKETEYERYVASIKSATSVYADTNPDAFSELYGEKSYVKVSMEELIKAGLLDDKIENPYTEETIEPEEEVIVCLDPETGALTVVYPLDEGNSGSGSESGVGTGSGSGSESGSSGSGSGAGSIIEGIKNKEVFLVAMSDYVVYGENYNCMQGAGSYELALSNEDGSLIMLNNQSNIDNYSFKCEIPSDFDAKKPGTYNVNYSWVTSRGIKKTQTRTLRVLPQVNPTVKYNTTYHEGEWYTPTYDATKKTWNYLTFTPTLEGVDEKNAVVRITKQSNDPILKREKVTINDKNNDFINDFKEYPVDDGDMTYFIDTIVYGHHDKGYSYVASGSINIKQKLVIPESSVGGLNEAWTTNKTFTINNVYSPVGIDRYEYKLTDSDKQLEKDKYIEELNTFKGNSKSVSIFNNSCKNKKTEYKYLFVRAINKNGHIGEWSSPININLTNELNSVIKGLSYNCSNASTCCKPNSDGSCNFNAKDKYIDFGKNKMIVLGQDKSGKVLTAYEGVSANRVTPTSIQSGTVSIHTCDGTYTYGYNYSSPVLSVITNEAQNFLKKLPSNYSDFLEYRTWEDGYTSYAGVPSKSDYDKYKNALADSNPYWTSTNFSTSFRINANWGGYYATRYNTYYYAVDNGNISSAYAGSSAYVKPMISIKTAYICSGDGSQSNPYKLAY